MTDAPLHERAGAAPLSQTHRGATDPLLVAEPEARRQLGDISRRKLAQMVASGEVPSVRIGRRRLFPLEGLRQYVADRTEGGR